MTPDPELRRARITALVALLGLLAVLLGRGPGASAAPTANGRIAYAADQGGDPEIYTAEPDGTGVTKLSDNDAWDTEPTVSPDGARIAFMSDRDGDEDIWVMNSDGTSPFNLTGSEEGSDTQPDWSPDGSNIAFKRNDDIFVVAVDGASPSVQLKSGRSPAWSPDGAQIAFIRPPGTDGDLFVMEADGTGVKELTSGLAADSPTWSPNGKRIAFEASDPDSDGDYHVFSTASDGTDLTKLTNDDKGQDFDPDYSPDGTSLVFTRVQRDADLFVSNANGSTAVPITPAGSYEFLASWGSRCAGSGCPTPTPDPSDTSSPSPTPTATGSPDPRVPTQISLNVVRTKSRLKAAGHLVPAHSGTSVSVKLFKRKGARWKRLVGKTVALRGDSYRVAFARPPTGRSCRIKVRWPGDGDHLPSARSKRTRC